MAETDFPLTGRHLRSRLVQLKAFIDSTSVDGEYEPSDEDPLLGRIFTDDELEWLEENEPSLFGTLQRIEEDYGKVVDASIALHLSQDAAEAMINVIELTEETGDDDEGDGDGEEPEDDGPFRRATGPERPPDPDDGLGDDDGGDYD